jgi:hypothetical protein
VQSNRKPGKAARSTLDILPTEIRRRIGAFATGNSVSPELPNVLILSFRAGPVSASSNGLM